MYTFSMSRISFQEWLNKQLFDRNLIPADITKRTGLSSSQISRIISGEREPGIDALIAIADALYLPRSQVFVAAGILENNNLDPKIESLAYRISKLPKDQQRIIDAMIDTILANQEN